MGYVIDVMELMMKELGVTIDYVVLPFAQQIAAFQAGKIDMIGGPITITPQRALRGIFADIPVFYEESAVVASARAGHHLARQARHLKDLGFGRQLPADDGRAAAAGRHLCPSQLDDERGQQHRHGSLGRLLISAGQLLGQIADHPDMKVMPGPPLWNVINSYMIPLGDFATHAWISNWLRYQSTHHTFSQLWQKWFVTATAKKFNVKTTAVGPLGEQVQF